MSRAGRGRDQPRAMIHRRILDVAAANPDASLASLADEVSGASASLVERVLEEYGDPSREPQSDGDTDQSMETTNVPDDDADSAVATEQASDTAADAESKPGQDSPAQSAGTPESEGSVDPDTDPSPDAESTPNGDTDSTSTATGGTGSENVAETDEPSEGDLDAADLSAKQRRTLRAVHERPDASQGDLAEQLDVTRATISRRLNAIPGFEWADRRAFAESVFEGDVDQANAVTAADSEETESDQANERADATTPNERSTGAEPEGEPGESRLAEESTESVDPADSVLSALGDVRASLAALDERVTALESQTSSTAGSESDSLPPELAHKVVHACMESERISEAEELELLRTLMQQ